MLVMPHGRRRGVVEIVGADGQALSYGLQNSQVSAWAEAHGGAEVAYAWDEDRSGRPIIQSFVATTPSTPSEEQAQEYSSTRAESPREAEPQTDQPSPALTHTAAPAPPADPALPYLLFDQADDEAVVARLKGLAVQSYVYHFNQKGQDVYGLGVDGAEACKRELARGGEVIEEEDVHIEKEDADAAYFKAYASRWAVSRSGNRIKLDTAIGTKRQAKHHESGQDNLFWFEQGCSKAIRNAILRLTPEEIKLRLIETYKATAKTVTVSRPGGFIRRR